MSASRRPFCKTRPLLQLEPSVSGRYLVDGRGAPFRVVGDASWYAAWNLAPSDQATYFADRLSKGFNATISMLIEHKFTLHKAPLDFASNLPFTKQLGGSTYTGSPNGTTGANGNNDQFTADNYSSASTQSPDFTFPNSAFFDRFADYLTARAAEGILVFVFPAYVGFGGLDEGWMVELAANDSVTGAGGLVGQPYADGSKSKAWNYGAFVADRFKSFSNVVWVHGGDYGSGHNSGTFTTPQKTAVDNLMLGMKSVAGQISKLHCAHFSRPSAPSDVALTDSFDLGSVYNDSSVASELRAAWAHAPAQPVFSIENWYEFTGTGGSAPWRQYHWWAATCGGGYFYGQDGTDPTYFFRSGYASQLATQTQQDLSRAATFFSTIAWWKLIPSGLSDGAFTQATIVTANGSTDISTDYVSAAAAADGTLCVAYVPDAWANGTFDVAMTIMKGTTTAKWFDPTNGSFTTISTSLANTGTHTFTPPGTNSAGDTDWVLLMTSP